jgi:hypothetical protein
MPPCCGAHGALLGFFLYSHHGHRRAVVPAVFAPIFLALLLIAGPQS